LVTVYVKVELPLGAVHDTVIDPLAATTDDTAVGAAGTVVNEPEANVGLPRLAFDAATT
jgi:hypothetical protein